MKTDDLMVQQSKIIASALSPTKIQDTCPILLIGKAVSLFKLMYKDTINELKNTNDVREFVSEYLGIKTSRPVVISDIGYLQKQATFLLLKLVEECEFPVILLSTNDSVSPIILSRVKTIIKFPVNEKTDNSMLSISDAYERLGSDVNNKMVNNIQFYAENCPQLYQLEQEVPFGKYRNTVIQILGGYYDKN